METTPSQNATDETVVQETPTQSQSSCCGGGNEQSAQKSSCCASKEDQQFWGMDFKLFSTLMHLSQFAGVIVPFGGFILPIVMWVTNKEQSEAVDKQGKIILNWIISLVIYSAAAGILSFLLIGIPILIVLGFLAIIFPIVGALKANNGITWSYPLSIDFMGVKK